MRFLRGLNIEKPTSISSNLFGFTIIKVKRNDKRKRNESENDDPDNGNGGDRDAHVEGGEGGPEKNTEKRKADV